MSFADSSSSSFLLHEQQTNSTSSCMTWRNHYMRCTRVNWAMSLSGCGIPMLKLKICLLQLEVKTSLSDWGGRDGIELAAGGLQMQDEMAGNVGFSACWCKVMLFQVTTNRKNMSSIIRRNWLLHLKLQYLLLLPMPRASVRTQSTYWYSKVLPSAFPAFGPYNSALKCSTVCLIS